MPNMGDRASRLGVLAVCGATFLLSATTVLASTPGADVRLSNDFPGGGYVSADDLARAAHYTDATLDECSRRTGRQNEPAVAIDPRNTDRDDRQLQRLLRRLQRRRRRRRRADRRPDRSGSATTARENGGTSFPSSLVPGYPGDTLARAARAKIRTASSGDPVARLGRRGPRCSWARSRATTRPAPRRRSATSGSRATSIPTVHGGATLNDGKEFAGSAIVAKGSSAPNLLGKFHDKTAIEADRTDSSCDGNVYFAWSRFTGNGGVAIYFSRSTDHGATFSQPMKLTASVHDVQLPEISVTGNGHVYVTYGQFEDSGQQVDGVGVAKSTDCGRRSRGRATVTNVRRRWA